MTNFDYLKQEPKFKSFADVAIAAEKVLHIDMESSALNCRRAMEFAIKWMYSADKSLELPYQDNLFSLMSTEEFRDLIDSDLMKRLELIRSVGNRVAHNGKKVTLDEVILCLQNLFIFMDFLSYCYADEYEDREFDAALLKKQPEIPLAEQTKTEIDLKALLEENKTLREMLTARREEQHQTYVPKPLDLSELDTRKIYIDVMLREAGWEEGHDWLDEISIPGMPTKTGGGRADYVLYDDAHTPLAIVEAKSTCKNLAEGRQQAVLYAEAVEKIYHRKPVVFLTNGFDTKIIDHQYPERRVSKIYSKRDLEKWFNLQKMRTSLKHISVDKEIAGRYYQEAAVKAVCDSFDEKNRRKALLVMATGSGKTRTVIALSKVLLNAGWVKNILFLADRNSLVTQAKRNFVNLLTDLSVTDLCEEKNNYNAHCVFSTYQTMMNCIDEAVDEKGKLYTCGHFDLIICDEAHRSIYNKYKDIFNYFDAPLVGLTATPKAEIDRNTYDIFELEKGVPTYGYELAQAVKDGYLVDYISVETKLKFMEEGIVYEKLPEEEKEEYENTFEQEDGNIPEKIQSSALNSWIFNEDTIRQVLHMLMTDGIKIHYGELLGKTIIFARNHNHAEKILEIFHKEYSYLAKEGFAQVIDNRTKYPQKAIDEFSDPQKMPQIAISVDMLDTGIDVPEVLNLVFFKKVMSKAKFWQMIGRGTRPCTGLLDGDDKEKFYIFDFCNNFEFFRMSNGKETTNPLPLQSAIFQMEFQLAYKLQALEYQTERLIAYRKSLVEHMTGKVKELEARRDKFPMNQHLKYVDFYCVEENYNLLNYEDTLIVREELSPIILADGDEINAVRFDALIYGLELAVLEGKKYVRARNDLTKRVAGIAKVGHIPEIRAQGAFIQKILHTDYLDRAGVEELEHIRQNFRSLMKYIEKDKHLKYDTDFRDNILSQEWNESQLENDDLKNYKAKAEYYIRKHQDNPVIHKLKTNQPLNQQDISSLEEILWNEVGTKEDYEQEYGQKPLGELVRELVGLDMNAAKEAFSQYLDGASLDSRQIYFVNQIVEYIVRNGMMKDLSVLQETPFTDMGSVVEIFTNMNVWIGIQKVIQQINDNAHIAVNK